MGDNYTPFQSGPFTAAKLRPPKQTLLKKADRFARSQFKMLSVTVCVLTPEETSRIRGGFSGDIKEKFWEQLESIVNNTLHCTDAPQPFHDDIANTRSTAYGIMDLHHIIPIRLCPVSLYPGKDWQQNWNDVLEWWRVEAQKNLAAVPQGYHHDIHAVQDRLTMLELGPGCLNDTIGSREYMGDINIIMKNSRIWLPPRRIATEHKEPAPPRVTPTRRKELRAQAASLLAMHSGARPPAWP